MCDTELICYSCVGVCTFIIMYIYVHVHVQLGHKVCMVQLTAIRFYIFILALSRVLSNNHRSSFEVPPVIMLEATATYVVVKTGPATCYSKSSWPDLANNDSYVCCSV